MISLLQEDESMDLDNGSADLDPHRSRTGREKRKSSVSFQVAEDGRTAKRVMGTESDKHTARKAR